MNTPRLVTPGLKTAVCLLFSVSALASAHRVYAQSSEFKGRIGQVGCRPAAERTGTTGCWIMANINVGRLPAGPVYWYLDRFDSARAAESAKGSLGVVVEALGDWWVFTIERPEWRGPAGQRIAEIGPLEVKQGAQYIARYMEAIFTPGMTSSVHRHSGPEAWYTVAGETCLETSAGKMIGRPGGPPVIVPEGLPMYLTATGTELRRSIVLILYDASRPAATPANDWTPKGVCNQR